MVLCIVTIPGLLVYSRLLNGRSPFSTVLLTRWSRRIRLRVLALLLMVVTAIATACSSTAPPPLESSFNPAELTQVVWLRPGDVDTLHPHRTTQILSWQVLDQIYDTLLAFDMEGNIRPNLARDWQPAPDGLTVTFWLNDGIRCHDGTVFDANDVKYTIDQAIDPDRPSLTRANWGAIAQVDVVDPLQVKLQFSEPFGAFLPFMADPYASMMCDTTPDPDPEDRLNVAVGTGPWQVHRWTPGEELVLQRNSDYVNYGRPVKNPGAPYLEQLVIRPNDDDYSRLSDLRWHEAHLITDLPLDSLDDVRQNRELQVHLAKNTGQSLFLQFTVSRPPFDDVRARQAVAYALDLDGAIASVFGDVVQRERCPIAAGVAGHDPDWCDRYDYDYDPDKARELLAEMGYSLANPMKVNLISWVGDRREDLLDVLRFQLAAVGIEADLDVMDIRTLNARVQLENEKTSGEGSFDLMGWAWYDADILHALWHSPGAYGGYRSPELDALLEDTRMIVDSKERLISIRAVQAYLLQNAVVIPVYSPGWLWTYASQSQLEGFTIGPFNRPVFNDVRWVTPEPES
ncbi:MAG: ABC transporter substrate-binding protein [Elainellaceae cyanobacterium]